MILALAVMWLGLFQVGVASSTAIAPGSDWCEAINAIPPGGEGVLSPGKYDGPCTLRTSGTPGQPIVIRASDLRDPAQIVFLGQGHNVLDIRASHVIVRGLRFGPTKPNVDAVRVKDGSDITIEDCRFEGIGGIAVVANHRDSAHIVVRRNEIIQSKATAMYFGCHDGAQCTVSDLLVERNYIRGVDAPQLEVGYGLQVKLNSTATIRDNVIVDTKGPGIMVYGASDLSRPSIIERNFVTASRNSSAIVVGGGPALVRNNVVTASVDAGIGLENYNGRGLLRRVIISHNTAYGNLKGGIVVPAQGRLDVTIVNNAAQALAGAAAFPMPRAGILSIGNVDCSMLPCFMDPALQDFSPLAIGRGSLVAEPWIPSDDYFGRRRETPPTAGAIETPARPLTLGIKPTAQ